MIAMTMTTGRRPELFKKTWESLRANMRDMDLVSSVDFFDDNSTPEQIEEMKAVAPQFSEWNLSKEVIGHAANMNRVHEHLRKSGMKWALLFEDDWQLTRFDCPLLASLDVLMNNEKIGQVCLGRIDMRFGYRGFTETGTMFTLREPVMPDGYTCFSLNPCLVRVDALLRVGEFKDIEGFERDYGQRWNKLGLLTADLFVPHLAHFGDGNSAYDILQTKR